MLKNNGVAIFKANKKREFSAWFLSLLLGFAVSGAVTIVFVNQYFGLVEFYQEHQAVFEQFQQQAEQSFLDLIKHFVGNFGRRYAQILYLVILSFGASLWAALKYFDDIGESAEKGERLRKYELKLIQPEELKIEIESSRRKKLSDNEIEITLTEHKIPLVDYALLTHILLVGASGAGKSNFINGTAVQLRVQGAKVIIIDPGLEYYRRFADPTRDVLLSIFDSRAHAYDLFAEKLDPMQLAQAIVPIKADFTPRDKFWEGGGRNLLAKFLEYSTSYECLWKFMNMTIQEVKKYFEDRGEPIAKTIVENSSSGSSEIKKGIALAELSYLEYLNHHARIRESVSEQVEKAFSMREWMENEQDTRWIFIGASDKDWEANKPFVNLLIQIWITHVLARGEGDGLRRMFLIADELSTLGNIPIAQLLDRGRKYKAGLIMGVQSIAQIRELYGTEGANRILNGFQTLCCFRMVEPELVQYFAKAFASEEKRFVSVGETLSEKGSSNVTTRIENRPLVTAGELRGLPDLTAILHIAGQNPARVKFKYVKYQNIHDHADKFSIRPPKGWLKLNTKLTPYRNLREREKSLFLEQLKAAVDQLLSLYQCSLVTPPVEEINAACQLVIKAMRGAIACDEVVDGEPYKLRLEAKETVLTIERGTTRVSFSLSQKSNNFDFLGGA